MNWISVSVEEVKLICVALFNEIAHFCCDDCGNSIANKNVNIHTLHKAESIVIECGQLVDIFANGPIKNTHEITYERARSLYCSQCRMFCSLVTLNHHRFAGIPCWYTSYHSVHFDFSFNWALTLHILDRQSHTQMKNHRIAFGNSPLSLHSSVATTFQPKYHMFWWYSWILIIVGRHAQIHARSLTHESRTQPVAQTCRLSWFVAMKIGFEREKKKYSRCVCGWRKHVSVRRVRFVCASV